MKIGFLGLLGILFIGLKLAGIITWSWWLVLLPLYGGLLVLIFVVLPIWFVLYLAADRRGLRRWR